jgi:hypothetical protein
MSMVKGAKEGEGEDEDNKEPLFTAGAAAVVVAEAWPSPKSRQNFLSRVAPPWMTNAFLFHISFKKYSVVKG